MRGLSHWPPMPSMKDVQDTRTMHVLRRVQTGTNPLGEKNWTWNTVAEIEAAIYPKSGQLRSSEPGLWAISSHELFTDYRLNPTDSLFIVRIKDIVQDDNGNAYLVQFVADEGQAHVYLRADLQFGVLNTLQDIAEQA